MKYNVHLEFIKDVYSIEAESQVRAYSNAVSKVLNIPRVQSEILFQEMIQAGMNKSYLQKHLEV